MALAKKFPSASIELQAIRFSNCAEWHVEKPTPVASLEWRPIVASGATATGAALLMAAKALENQSGDNAVSVVALITDGMPTDSVNRGIKCLDSISKGGHVVRIAVAMGDVDYPMLRQFVTEESYLYNTGSALRITDQLIALVVREHVEMALIAVPEGRRGDGNHSEQVGASVSTIGMAAPRRATGEYAPPEASKKIFISYRRLDSGYVVPILCDRLRVHFGNDSVFLDEVNVPLGVDFTDYISEAVGQCDLMLVVIGDKWLDICDDRGERRLNNPVDHVRVEVESALRRGIPVVPVLVQEAAIPNAKDLPESLHPLVYRNAAEVRANKDLMPDLNRLAAGLLDLLTRVSGTSGTSAAPRSGLGLPWKS